MRLYAIFAHIAIVNYRPEKPNIVSHRVVICRITEYAILANQIIIIKMQHLSSKEDLMTTSKLSSISSSKGRGEKEKEYVQGRKRQMTICRRGLFLDRICRPLQNKQEIHPCNVDCYFRHCLRRHLQRDISEHLNR